METFIAIGCSLILFIRINTVIYPNDPEKYTRLLSSLSYRFTRADWILFFVSFYYICITVGYGIVAAFVSLLYLWQRGYEFFRMEHNMIVTVINKSKIEIDGAVWTFVVRGDHYLWDIYPPYTFVIEFFKDGKEKTVANSVVVHKYAEVKCELKNYILLNIKQ